VKVIPKQMVFRAAVVVVPFDDHNHRNDWIVPKGRRASESSHNDPTFLSVENPEKFLAFSNYSIEEFKINHLSTFTSHSPSSIAIAIIRPFFTIGGT
jgi:hypothetical protein